MAKNRQRLFEIEKERLQELASRGLAKGLAAKDFEVVCIEVDDPLWMQLVNALMPHEDWQKIRDRGETPIARGITIGISADVEDIMPDSHDELYRELPDDSVRVIVMGFGGVSVFFVQPVPEIQHKANLN